MAKVLKCSDAGIDCDFVAKAETEEELMKQVSRHAAEKHGMTEMSREKADHIKSLIKDE